MVHRHAAHPCQQRHHHGDQQQAGQTPDDGVHIAEDLLGEGGLLGNADLDGGAADDHAVIEGGLDPLDTRCLWLPVDGHQAQGPSLGGDVRALNERAFAFGCHCFEGHTGLALEAPDVLNLELNRGGIALLHEEAGVREGGWCHRELRLEPFHVPGRQEGVVEIPAQAGNGVSGKVSTGDADLDFHPVDQHLVGDFAKVHVAVEFEAESINRFAFQRQGLPSGPNDITGFEVLHLPDQFKRIHVKAAQFLNDHTDFVVLTTQDGTWARREHLLRLGPGAVNDDPFDRGGLIGQVNALPFKAAYFPRHGQGT